MVKIYIWITRRENMYIAYQFIILTSDWSIRIKLNRRRFWVGHWYFVNKETMFWSLVTQNDISMFINNQILRYDSFLWIINNPKFSTNQDDLPGNQSETSINLIFLEKLNHNLFRTRRTWNSKSYKFHNRQWRHLCHDKNRKWTFKESSSKSIGHCRIVAKGWTSAAAPNKDFESLEIVAKRTEICSILSQTSSQVKYSFG